MADTAYKVLQDTSLPRPIRTSTTTDGVEVEEVTGQAYAAGDYVYASELSAAGRQRLEDGELDDFLEEVSADEAETARNAVATGLFIPEHEVERYVLLDAGHRVVEKDQVLDLRAAGAEAARDAMEASKKGPNEGNPAITEQPSFVEVSSITDGTVLPGEGKQDEVSEFDIVNAPGVTESGVEMPPGLPVGPTLAKAEGADPEKVDESVEKASKRSTRKKPGSSSSSESKSDGQS
jgi:hypothetical protein